MTVDDLRHALHLAPAVYFVLRGRLARAQFDRVIGILAEHGSAGTAATPEDHWRALERRLSGASRWDTLVPRYSGSLDGVENMQRSAASLHTVGNILSRRPYTSYTRDGVTYVVDVFNPANELELPYRGAGETVVALLLTNTQPGAVRDRLATIDSFYETVQQMAGVLEPEYVRGTYGMAPTAFACREGRVDPGTRPWEFLYPLSVLAGGDLPDAATLRTVFARVEPWPDGRVLLQVANGIDATLLPEYVTAARMVGMTAVQELVPGAYGSSRAKARRR